MRDPSRTPGNPYRILYWVGGFLVLLIAGVVALSTLVPRPQPPRQQPPQQSEPERTLIWIDDPHRPSVGAVAVILEESRTRKILHLVAFPVPSDLVQVRARSGAKQAWEAMAQSLGRPVHHAVFLPAGVIARLIDATGGISLGGQTIKGAAALAYLQTQKDQPREAVEVLMALADAASTRGVSMGVREGLALARQIETDLDLLDLPAVLGRWSGYSAPTVETLPEGDLAAVQARLMPDGVGANGR